jgi:hypothetical protein
VDDLASVNWDTPSGEHINIPVGECPCDDCNHFMASFFGGDNQLSEEDWMVSNDGKQL